MSSGPFAWNHTSKDGYLFGLLHDTTPACEKLYAAALSLILDILIPSGSEYGVL